MSKAGRRWSANRIVAAGFFASLITASITAAALAYLQDRTASATVDDAAEAVVDLLAYNLAAPVAFADMTAADEVLRSVQDRNDVEGVRVFGPKGETVQIMIAGNEAGAASLPRLAEKYDQMKDGGLTGVSQPIRLGRDVLGRVELLTNRNAAIEARLTDWGDIGLIIAFAIAAAMSVCGVAGHFFGIRTGKQFEPDA